MYGLKNLKPVITITATYIECPVRGCDHHVQRWHRGDHPEARFQCPEHRIYISPTTFEYPDEKDNLLWKNEADLALLETIKAVKREIRMEHDNSEDAVTWNVFRYMETANLLTGFLSSFTHNDQGKAELIYWSYSQVTGTAWLGLDRARKEFGEHLHRSSEPDLIAVTDKALFFIEAKLKAKNDTSPSNPKERKKYLSGGGGWFQKVFVSEYEPVAIQSRKYELMRFWLLGSWLAEKMERDFYLVNLVPAMRETDIEELFIPHIRLSDNRQFKRLAWEQIYAWVAGCALDCPEKRSLVTYIENKTIGYNRFGELQKAFFRDQPKLKGDIHMVGRIKSGEGTLIGNAGEYFVMAELLKRGVIAALAPRNAPGFDILATKPEKTVRIRVKTKSEEYNEWQWMVKKDGSIFRYLQSEEDFTVLVNLTDETKDMDYFILPTTVVNKWLNEDFKTWLATPGKGGRSHSSDNPKRNLNYNTYAEKLDEYQMNWDLLWKQSWN